MGYTMSISNRRAAAALGAVTLASAVWATPAVAAAPAPSRITVHASATTVRSGEQFILRGRMTSLGEEVPNTTVRVSTLRNGEWQRLRGAVVNTRDDGKYRIRIILSQTGERQLRVVGDPPGDAIRIARAFITIHVTR